MYKACYRLWSTGSPPGVDFSWQMAWGMALTLSVNVLLLICLPTFNAWLVNRLMLIYLAARKMMDTPSNALQGHSPCVYYFKNQRWLVIADWSFFPPFLLLFTVFLSFTEKDKRVKTSSDGEGASNSQSDSSASLGSLKGGGESCHLTSHLSHSLCHSIRGLGEEEYWATC